MHALGTQAVSEHPMANPGPIEGVSQTAVSKSITIETRYGTYEVDRDKTVTLPKGLIGFSELQEFALLNLPHDGADRFKLLQSVEEPGIGLYVLPVGLEDSGFDRSHIEDAAGTYDIALEDLAILLIVTARKNGEKVDLTANLLAPVLVDTEHRVAFQHVMTDDRYPMQHKLN
ncbi:MAG: flagellar assembly protein FliW [Inquilinus sp.]|nr:flagellar assembly protein FliW [Inquilinus sp.]